MYKTYSIANEQVIRAMQVKENYLNDVKAKEIKPAKLSETISAFANAAGGDVYIGISEVEKAAKSESGMVSITRKKLTILFSHCLTPIPLATTSDLNILKIQICQDWFCT